MFRDGDHMGIDGNLEIPIWLIFVVVFVFLLLMLCFYLTYFLERPTMRSS